MRNCSYCFKEVKDGIYAMHLDVCRHWVHTGCLDKKDPDFDNCPQCKGEIKLIEPPPINKRDYISDPLQPSYWDNFKISWKKKEPFVSLDAQTPIVDLIIHKQYGLQKLLEAGVTIEDFIQNDYTWDDLKKFKDIGDVNNKDRAKKALVALRCNAEHFRDAYHILGPAIKDLGITGRDMVELFGIYFDDKKPEPMQVAGGLNNILWNASDVLKLGMTMKDLYGARLTWAEQYLDLHATDEEAKKLGVKLDEELPSFHEQQQQNVIEVVIPEQSNDNRVVIEIHEPTVIERKPIRKPIVHYEKAKLPISHGLRKKK